MQIYKYLILIEQNLWDEKIHLKKITFFNFFFLKKSCFYPNLFYVRFLICLRIFLENDND